MSNSIHQIETNDDDLDEEDEDDFDEMWEDDDWGDEAWEAMVRRRHPGWYFVKLTNMSWSRFKEIEAWCKSNVKYGGHANVDWTSGCSTKYGVAFESGKDAMMFKLRWR